MTVAEFVSRMVGVPWVRWRSDFHGADCFGVLVLFHRHVLGIELGEVPQTDIAAGFAAAPGWRECDPQPGVTCFMAWDDGAPTHCGVLLGPDEVLHSDGNQDHPGSARVSSLRLMRRVHQDIRFYRFEPSC